VLYKSTFYLLLLTDIALSSCVMHNVNF